MSSKLPEKPRALLVVRRVVGHSMLPVLPPRTLVIGTGIGRKYSVGKVVVILHEGKEKIKRIADIRKDEVFVVGDNEDGSTDSRHFGWLPIEVIQAQVIWPRRLRTIS